MGYICGYLASNAVDGLGGIQAYLQTQTSDAAGAFPTGGNLSSIVALQVQDTAASQLLRVRLGYGLFRLNAQMDPTAFLFAEMLVGNQRSLRMLGQPGSDKEFHSYAAAYDPEAGAWSLQVDAMRVGTLQADAWKDPAGKPSTRQLVPAFLAEVSVSEVPVLGTSANAVEVEAAQLEVGGQLQDLNFAGGDGSGVGSVVWTSETAVGTLGTVGSFADSFTISAAASGGTKKS
ncbi:hypothetical protein SAMN06265365_13247 [Tistlia consotensis]|uniref:Uncharacterized protein n=1 Tax=Tistlia consotensis USBA 355 TaxID=560819 RepID=A0A1Y6CLW0_9PROT|nr:hypothetical protein [Tistlia consotensis]SMF76401.1 hypothetical protein SAMN05428998_13547 [Tistlia consotensis USBA 355]SNS12863.1 hypothetical protein SAMN06265365_13247 [Tistlia consotensis]